MKNAEKSESSEILRLLPATDALLRSAAAVKLLPLAGAAHLTALTRRAVDELRCEIREEAAGRSDFSRESLLAEAEKRLEDLWRKEQNARLRRVINATGVIVHTNLGRAPLADAARQAIFAETAGYCNLEYDLETGKRGRRGAGAEQLLAELTGAESAVIVNNCAAAAFLVLTVLASGGEVVTSRGELVEIGGDFRVPDVMTQSGAILSEVGTTNRTKISDYEKAINENTRLLMKVHPSNYRIVGFTEAVEIGELAELARRHRILVYEDAGSGALFDLSASGLTDEPVIAGSVAAGADVVTFSGDKLLGGVQSGLIVGRRETIEKIRRHPLYRALRVDKLIYAALEATFDAFLREKAAEEIPVLRMLSMSEAELEERALSFARRLREKSGANSDLRIETVKGHSVVGGGSAPLVQPPTTLLACEHARRPAAKLEEALRFSSPPVIARILEDKVLIDLRTVAAAEETELLAILAEI
jgi:L-seryl-tRNA(Ser) seleniumtransferase